MKTSDKRIIFLLDLIAQQSARLTELEQKLEEIEAVWPQIVEQNNGTD